MKNILKITSGLLFIALTPLAALAASASVQSLTPGSTVLAKNQLTFTVSSQGFAAQQFQITDSFPNTSINSGNINPGGNFSWVPNVSDVGTHVLTITAQDLNGTSATITQNIVVSPPPSISIGSLSPGGSVMPGNKVTFIVSQMGFTNPKYSASDSFGGSGTTITNTNIDTSGNFSWTPDISQNGQHTITIYAYDSLGHSSSASQKIQIGAGPSLLIQGITPGTNVPLGKSLTLSVVGQNFSPTSFMVTDNFPGSTVTYSNINTNGAFAWSPQSSDAGTHTLTFTGIVGAYGDRASTTQQIIVLGPGGVTPASTATTTPTQSASSTALSVLQAQLAALQAKVGTDTTPPPAASQETAAYTFSVYLHPGMRSDDVKYLQLILIKLGFFSDEANGVYGSATTEAVVKFQKAHKLNPLGVVGPGTRKLLNSLHMSDTKKPISNGQTTLKNNGYVFEHFMGNGDDDSDVLELQKRLVALGYLSDATGFYGSATETAVKKFQKAHGLPKVGYVDSLTRGALNQ